MKNTSLPFWGLVAIAVLLTLTSFSNAYANPTCGDTITVDTTLIADLDCTTLSTSGLIIGADNITIDLGGFTLSGDTTCNCHGIQNNGGFDNVTIQGGTINGFEQGVRGEGVTNYILDSLTFTGQTSSHAIDIR